MLGVDYRRSPVPPGKKGGIAAPGGKSLSASSGFLSAVSRVSRPRATLHTWPTSQAVREGIPWMRFEAWVPSILSP